MTTRSGRFDLDAPLREADFEVVRPLGSGGMGEVFEAVQKSLRKRVALKLIKREALDSPGRVRRFFAEARAVARLRHPHIVGVHGIGRMADGRYFLVMDLVEGGATVAGLLHRGPVPFDRAAELVATVAEAIEHAHSRGVIHRDLKPSNVLLDAEGRPHVTDFGLAKVFDATDPDNPQTTADQILGTPHYMAPEQADPARGPIAPRTDVYALGGLLYALLTGKPPIRGDSLTAILTRVVSPEPVASPRELRGDVPTALERICGTCLAKDAEERHPSAGAVAAELRAWLVNPGVEDAAGAPAASPQRTTESSNEPGRTRSGWSTDRSLKDGVRPPDPPRWPARSAPSARPRRRIWAAGAGVSTLVLLLLAVNLVRTRISKDQAHFAPAVGPQEVADAKPAPTSGVPPSESVESIESIESMPPVAAPTVAAPSLISNNDMPGLLDRDARQRLAQPPSLSTLPSQAVGSDPGARPRLAGKFVPPPDLVAGWEVHVYRPDADGKIWLDLGNVLETPVAIRAGDGLRVRATFREPVHAAVLAIEPAGSVRRLGAPADADAEPLTTELTIPPGGDRYLPLTGTGPTAVVLLASRRPLWHPVGGGGPVGGEGPGLLASPSGPLTFRPPVGPARTIARSFQPHDWRASHAEKTWIFDGRAIVPIRKTETIEKAVGTRPFVTIGEALKADPGLNGSRAVFFEVAAPNQRARIADRERGGEDAPRRPRSPVHHIAAVDVDRLAGDIPPAAGGEEDGHGGDVLGLLPSVQGDKLLDLVGRPFLVGRPVGLGLLAGPGLVDPPVEWGLDHARTERIDSHSRGRQVLGGALGEVDHGGLGRAVGRVGLRPDLAGDR